ncbi:MAG: DUF3105 domain-containing protein [Egibacteraceae bacterium]
MKVRAPRPWLAVAVVAVLLVVVALVTFGEPSTRPMNRLAGGSGPCAPEALPRQQFGSHLIGDRPPPVPYSSTPPTSGWHASGGFAIAVNPPNQPLSEPRQVSVLEAGGVVVAYHELSAVDRDRLETHVRERFPGRVAVTSYDKLGPGEVAFAAWGVLQRCDGLDLDVLDAFVTAHGAQRPDTRGAH